MREGCVSKLDNLYNVTLRMEKKTHLVAPEGQSRSDSDFSPSPKATDMTYMRKKENTEAMKMSQNWAWVIMMIMPT